MSSKRNKDNNRGADDGGVELREANLPGAKVKVQSNDLFSPQNEPKIGKSSNGNGSANGGDDDQQKEAPKQARKLPARKQLHQSSSEEEDSFDNKYSKMKPQKQLRKKPQRNDEDDDQPLVSNTPGNPNLEQDRPIRRRPPPPQNEDEDEGSNTNRRRGRGGNANVGGRKQQQQEEEYNEDDELYEDELYQMYTMNNTKIWQLAHYKEYFDVSTVDILHRLRKAIWPFCSKSSLFEDEDRIDLYGPVWIMLTLIVEIAIVGFIDYQIDITTAALELKAGKINTAFITYSLLKVARAAFVCIAYFVTNPLLLLLLIKYVLWIPEVQYLWIFSIYGYSFTIFVITTALNVVPIEWMKWVFLGVSGVVSLFAIISEMYAYIKSRLEQGFCKFIFVCLFLVLTHAIFIFALRKYFLT
eukprot:403346293